MKWQELESLIRSTAQYKWDAQACPETINGVKVDCVLHIRPDHWIVIEITQEDKLAKLREDLAKFATIRPYLFSRSIYAECHFVCETSPPPSLIESGAGHNVQVLSAAGFTSLFFDYATYARVRKGRRFGSAVDLSGNIDARSYVPVHYADIKSGRELTIADLADALRNGRRIVLIGNYGTGKSRCIRELFTHMSDGQDINTAFPLAIDLRDNWGTKRAGEIIRRHFDDMALSHLSSSAAKLAEDPHMIFLLDGFDEMGSQTWSDDPRRLGRIRAESLYGVKDLISRAKGGIIVSGREHYFNSDDEMFRCLGLSVDTTVRVRCADEFSREEMQQYLSQLDSTIVLPSWLPKRPFVCQIMAGMEETTLKALGAQQGGEFTFWKAFMTALCDREARIHQALDATTIAAVVQRLARLTRTKAGNTGPLSPTEINHAFEHVTGLPPVDESAAMLQRLPGLGRLSSESGDRHFIDEYILDGLRVEDVIHIVETQELDVANVKWTHPLRDFGLSLLSHEMETAGYPAQYLRLMKMCAARQNAVLAGDILASRLIAAGDAVDCEMLSLTDSHIRYLDLSSHPVMNLNIQESIIEKVDIADCTTTDVKLSGNIIRHLLGVAAASGLPPWMAQNDVEMFESVSTVSRIKKADISESQRILVTIIKKLFFQPGAGRKEEALLRGLGTTANKKAANRILNDLHAQGIIEKFKGKEGWVYTPVRHHAKRMNAIMTSLTLSKDPLWLAMGKSR